MLELGKNASVLQSECPGLTYRYRAFGLAIKSQIALPELRVDLSEDTADVVVAPGQVPQPDRDAGTSLGPFAWAARDWLWLEVVNIARFFVQGGRQIIIEPCPGVDDDSVRLFLLGSVFGGLLLQRGHLVLHGNAIDLGGQALVCVGESGAGKSTLALGFQRQGHSVLADDVVAIDASHHALPGIPRVKIWRDVADRFAIDPGNLARVRSTLEKYALVVADEDNGKEPLPVRWICRLRPAHVSEVRIERVDGTAAFGLLFDNLYRPLLAQSTFEKAELLGRIGKLAAVTRIATVYRPIDGFDLDPLITSLREFVESEA